MARDILLSLAPGISDPTSRWTVACFAWGLTTKQANNLVVGLRLRYIWAMPEMQCWAQVHLWQVFMLEGPIRPPQLHLGTFPSPSPHCPPCQGAFPDLPSMVGTTHGTPTPNNLPTVSLPWTLPRTLTPKSDHKQVRLLQPPSPQHDHPKVRHKLPQLLDTIASCRHSPRSPQCPCTTTASRSGQSGYPPPLLV